jgi:hypothetical protein
MCFDCLLFLPVKSVWHLNPFCPTLRDISQGFPELPSRIITHVTFKQVMTNSHLIALMSTKHRFDLWLCVVASCFPFHLAPAVPCCFVLVHVLAASCHHETLREGNSKNRLRFGSMQGPSRCNVTTVTGAMFGRVISDVSKERRKPFIQWRSVTWQKT